MTVNMTVSPLYTAHSAPCNPRIPLVRPQVQLSDALLRSLVFFPTTGGRGSEVAWLDGITVRKNKEHDTGDQGQSQLLVQLRVTIQVTSGSLVELCLSIIMIKASFITLTYIMNVNSFLSS